jgi:hypothetical protein
MWTDSLRRNVKILIALMIFNRVEFQKFHPPNRNPARKIVNQMPASAL